MNSISTARLGRPSPLQRAKTALRSALWRGGLLLCKTDHPSARYFQLPPRDALAYALHRAFADTHGLQVLQIGAHDGQRNDPIFRLIRALRWRATLVEPIPSFVAKLRALHADNPLVRIVPAAIAEERGTRPLHRIDDSLPGLPAFAPGLATLDRARIETACHDLRLPLSAVVQEPVQTIRWMDLEPETPLARIDVLVIDAEGYDLVLLRAWDWTRFRPPVLHFEHACSDPAEHRDFLARLTGLGYDVAIEGANTTAWIPADRR